MTNIGWRAFVNAMTLESNKSLFENSRLKAVYKTSVL